ncbi:glucan biosynthesis protein [Halomonas sp. ATCHA]|uniref:Glucan biosynthesis protein n=2 Tax=Halomonas llamarensis TaxID=2945104 RepID=A0ABT0SPR6_9GAMM|nr:glucan biosynthesis protein [Halomonas llamarensis]MCL7929834.1 glucan biosynthesis protein [Halomonas llamarensis]
MAEPSDAELSKWQGTLRQHAQTLAEASYSPPNHALPQALKSLDYDTYRQIRFDPARAYWGDDSRFSLQLFHSGFLFPHPVMLHLVEGEKTTSLTFDSDDFIYEGQAEELQTSDLQGTGHAGFRLHYPLNTSGYRDEFAVFLGASYFRLIGRDQVYGLSTRGLAIDTALSSNEDTDGEEFPAFREFWLFTPEANDTAVHVMALLDSPSLSGAYHFRLEPGHQTQVDVDATLYARDDVTKLGIAPLTSMFAYGDMSRNRPDDVRPRVHDSDGLLLETGRGEWIWRPLNNPRRVRVSAFLDTDPQGFGLMQREHEFSRYLDEEAQYHRRPSQWVTPQGDWGKGHVELVELPSPDETHDNIVAYWVSETPLRAGESLSLRYQTQTRQQAPTDPLLAQVIRTRQGSAAVPGEADSQSADQRQWVVDFAGGELARLSADQPVALRLDAPDDAVTLPQVKALPDNTWRATFRVKPTASPLDVRLALTLHGETLSETWNYVIDPLPKHGDEDA